MTNVPMRSVSTLRVVGEQTPSYRAILNDEALAFLDTLVRRFSPRLDDLLYHRARRQAAYDAGEAPDYLPETRDIREGDWHVGAIPSALRKRHVEITGPVERKMIINALNSGADAFMADFEDSSSPTWQAMMNGQVNLRDAVAGTITYDDPAKGKSYALKEKTAVLLVRPRGLHLPEAHVEVDGRPIPGCLFDFAMFLYHNHHRLLAQGKGPYFYIPKLEHYAEARWWSDVMSDAEASLGLPVGTIKVTVLIETLPAVFQLNEILHALRHHIVGLNCGRWDYMFSAIKTLRAHADWITPDRSLVTMTQPMMRAYALLTIATCHRRGAYAMGGMAAQIPITNNPEANEAALEKVRADKKREAGDGHDGTWVAHPGLIDIARHAFDSQCTGDHQMDKIPDVSHVTRALLLQVPEGDRTEEGLRQNINVGIRYLASWISGSGCVPINNLMEDAATAEISRTQVWQWLKYHAVVGGSPLTMKRFLSTVDQEVHAIQENLGKDTLVAGALESARRLFVEIATREPLIDFLTSYAYNRLG